MNTTGYEFWQRALQTGELPPVDSEVQPGFYRLEGKSAVYPVAAWPDSETGLNVLIGSQHLRENDPATADKLLNFAVMAWPKCIAVSEPDYRTAVSDGRWADFAPVSRFSNQAPEGFEALRDEIMELVRQVDEIVKAGPAKSQAEADRSGNIKSKLQQLWKAAEDERKREKKPHDDAAKAVQAKFSPILDAASIRVSRLNVQVIEPFLKEQRKKAEEAAQKVEQETGAKVELKTSAGARGSKTVLKSFWRAEIEDYGAALKALADHPDVVRAVEGIANAAARSKARLPIPGVKFIEDKRAA